MLTRGAFHTLTLKMGGYLGFFVRMGRIVSLVFPKYVTSLADRVRAAQYLGIEHFIPEDQQSYMVAIQSAVRHLHSSLAF